MRQANPPQILGLKPQESPLKTGAICGDEQTRDARQQHRPQGLEIPEIRREVIQIVVRIQLPILINHLRIALDVGNEQLGYSCKGRRDAVNGAIPARRLTPGHMTCADRPFMSGKVSSQAGIIRQGDDGTVIGKGVETALPTPNDPSGGDIPGGGQRQLPVVLDVQPGKRPNKHLVRPRGHADTHMAAGFLQQREVPLESLKHRRLRGGFEHPRRIARSNIRQFQNIFQRGQVRRHQSGGQGAQGGGMQRWSNREPGAATGLAGQHGDRRICQNGGIECVRSRHINVKFKPVAIGHHPP